MWPLIVRGRPNDQPQILRYAQDDNVVGHTFDTGWAADFRFRTLKTLENS
jgi:hypothetical protein